MQPAATTACCVCPGEEFPARLDHEGLLQWAQRSCDRESRSLVRARTIPAVSKGRWSAIPEGSHRLHLSCLADVRDLATSGAGARSLWHMLLWSLLKIQGECLLDVGLKARPTLQFAALFLNTAAVCKSVCRFAAVLKKNTTKTRNKNKATKKKETSQKKNPKQMRKAFIFIAACLISFIYL